MFSAFSASVLFITRTLAPTYARKPMYVAVNKFSGNSLLRVPLCIFFFYIRYICDLFDLLNFDNDVLLLLILYFCYKILMFHTLSIQKK